MEHDPETLRKQARSISSAAKAPGDAWKDLRTWASEGGPMAMDIAVQEFITSYGRDPASARLIPEAMHSVHLSPLRKDFGIAPLSRGHVTKHLPALSVSPKPVMGLSREAVISMKPLSVLTAPLDPMSIRDMPLRMHEGIRQSLRLPMRSDGKERSGPDQTRPPQRGMRSMSAGQSGEQIIQSLIGNLSSHGRNDVSSRTKKAGKPAKKAALAPKKRAKKAGSKRKRVPIKKSVKKKPVKRKPQKRRSSRKR